MSQEFAAQLREVQTNAEAELRRIANDNAATVTKLKQDAIASEAAVRLEAESAFKEQFAEATRQRQTAEDARIALQAQFHAHREASDGALARAKEEAAAREAAARTAAATEANALWRAQLEESDRAKEAAEAQFAALAASQQERLDEHRVALEKAKDDAVNAEKAKAFDEKRKLETQLKDLARQLEKKTADELGEGAEVKLLDELKDRFGEDTFTHIGKGNA
ncbi:MAG: hypothetical protein ACRD36_04450, partial [Candidatus Acidiferrum sp.]